MKQVKIKIGKELDGMRLDIALVQAEIDMSRRKIRRIIDVGGAYLNNRRVRVASRQVREGDVIRLEFQEEQVRKLKPTNFTLSDRDILYENDQLLVINKPPGLPSQATRDQSILHVLPVLQRFYQASPAPVPELILVHRLDKETSGALIIAKNAAAATFLTEQFRKKLVAKEYLAVCFGIAKEMAFEFECHLSSIQPKTGVVEKVRSGGKFAHTKFEVEAVNPNLGLSLVRCHPTTGRSHQLRVHLDLNGLPIVGDKKYGAAKRPALPEPLSQLASAHQLLHCHRMVFRWSDAAPPVDVTAPMPPNLQKFTQAAFRTEK